MRALNRALLRDLVHLRGQVVAVAAVVTCGVATFVGLRSVYESLVLSQEAYYRAYDFADVFSRLRRAPETVEPRIAAIPGVAAVQTRVVGDVVLDVPGLDEPAVGRLISLPDRGRPLLNGVHVRRGSLPAPGANDEVLVSEGFAEENGLEVGDTLGAIVGGRWRRMRIAGIGLSPEYVYEIRGAGEPLPDPRRFGVLWMVRAALAPDLDMDGAFNDVALALSPGASEERVIDALDAILDPYGGLGAHGREDQTSHRFLSDEIAQNRVTSSLVPAIFLGVAAFLLNILLSRLVSTQRDQIAVLKAFGYTDLRVGTHYALFAMATVLMGVLAGTALGAWVGSASMRIYSDYYRFAVTYYELSPGVLLTAIGVNVAASLVGAARAVRHAVSLPPAEAMRPESPPQYRPGLVERLRLHRLFSPATRITIRNIERRPVRALLTMVGVALAVAILVVGRFFFDAVAFVMDLQFRQIQREDVTVVFERALPSRAQYEAERLPGVQRAEPYRFLPVRLRNGQHEHLTAIQGRDPGGELRPVIGRDGVIVPIPPDGLLLTATLAEMLDVRPGDVVRAELLEGRRVEREIPVAGTVDEVIGVSGYMSLDAMRRLTRERTISGVYLAVERSARQRLYDRLKELPSVAAVSVREVAVRNFEDSIAGTLRVATTTLVIFASVIAFGIVYNGARIALSERGRELATLRVLGFRRGEVAGILLGEQALLTLAAIPFGLVLGYGIAAIVVQAATSELFRFPLVISTTTYLFASLVVAGAAAVSGLVVRRRLDRIDLIEVLKSRE